MIDCIIFDCDGVLIDSEILSFAVDQQILAGYGINLQPDEIARDFGGISYGEMVSTLNERFDMALDAAHYQQQCEDILYDVFRRELRAIDGMANVLENLRVPVCVASGSDLDRLALCLGITQLENFFKNRVFSAQQVAKGKPAPDLFLFAAKQMGISPHHCLVIEDSPSGVVAANRAGMQAVGFLGGRHRQNADPALLHDAGACHVVASGDALLSCLRDMGLAR
ncbi:HAD family phosphatase [Thalassospira sp. TSL5-1]|uniref:HAD family hydrolase n=1 Tax=Thalassospira sp. TSL5-1 TaxID=1544451 RepID=UPI00093E2E0A|nr:HAD family hydrolase [Thalassospira sp. TSL5-1]